MRLQTILLAMGGLVAFALTNVSSGTYSGGTGEPNDPYRIATAEDLNDIGNHEGDWDNQFVLVADINLADYNDTKFNMIGERLPWDDANSKPFMGVFDGDGHVISNFACLGSYHVGLFAYVGIAGEIKNLILEDIDIYGGAESMGAVAGYNEGQIMSCRVTGSLESICDHGLGGLVGANCGTISDCSTSTTVTWLDDWWAWGSPPVGGLVGTNSGTVSNCNAGGDVEGRAHVGGLVGENISGIIRDCNATGQVRGVGGLRFAIGGLVGYHQGGTISGCNASGDVEGYEDVGGLVGWNEGGTITGCNATGQVTRTGYGRFAIGGLVGYHQGGMISGCSASGPVTGDTEVGGLAGRNIAAISDCYATGLVSGVERLGGLVGYNRNGAISNCYSTGSVSGDDYLGGLVGYDFGGSYSKCFWDADMSADANGIGNWDDPNVTGKPTEQMQKRSTFTEAGWDFVEVWDIGENQTYPFLRMRLAGDINHDDKVNFLDLAILAAWWLERAE